MTRKKKSIAICILLLSISVFFNGYCQGEFSDSKIHMHINIKDIADARVAYFNSFPDSVKNIFKPFFLEYDLSATEEAISLYFDFVLKNYKKELLLQEGDTLGLYFTFKVSKNNPYLQIMIFNLNKNIHCVFRRDFIFKEKLYSVKFIELNMSVNNFTMESKKLVARFLNLLTSEEEFTVSEVSYFLKLKYHTKGSEVISMINIFR